MVFIGMDKGARRNPFTAFVCRLSNGVHSDGALRYVVEGWQ